LRRSKETQKAATEERDPVAVQVSIAQLPCQNPRTLGTLGDVGELQAEIASHNAPTMTNELVCLLCFRSIEQ
jgi:hypothetical protein